MGGALSLGLLNIGESASAQLAVHSKQSDNRRDRFAIGASVCLLCKAMRGLSYLRELWQANQAGPVLVLRLNYIIHAQASPYSLLT